MADAKVSGNKLALMCPVPCEHMESAIETCSRPDDVVAFGSQMQEMFFDHKRSKEKRQLIDADTTVYIYVSLSGGANPAAVSRYFDGKRITYIASYLEWRKPKCQFGINTGFHPNDKHRPGSTLGENGTDKDTVFMGFWEIRGLKELPVPIPLSKFRLFDKGSRIHGIPRHPIKVVDLEFDL